MTQASIVLAADVKPLDQPEKLVDKKKAQKEVAVGKTDGGKDVLIGRGPAGRGFEVRYSGGGELPLPLRGLWLRFDDALNAIRGYANSPDSPISEVAEKVTNVNTPGLG